MKYLIGLDGSDLALDGLRHVLALARQGLDPLVQAVYEHVAAARNAPVPDPEPPFEPPAQAAGAALARSANP